MPRTQSLLSPYCWHAPLSRAALIYKCNLEHRPMSTREMTHNVHYNNAVIVKGFLKSKCRTRTWMEELALRDMEDKRLHKKIVVYVLGSLRQVWACIWRDECYTGPFALWGRMEIKSYLCCISSGLVRGKEISSHPSFSRSGAAPEQDGVMHIQLLFCVTFGLRERTLNRLKNKLPTESYSENQDDRALFLNMLPWRWMWISCSSSQQGMTLTYHWMYSVWVWYRVY